MKFKTLFLSLILASSLLVGFNGYALSAVEGVCNPDKYAPSFDEIFEPILTTSGYKSWCAKRQEEERWKNEKLIIPDIQEFLKLDSAGQGKYYMEIFLLDNKWKRSLFGVSQAGSLEFYNKQIQFLTKAIEQGINRDNAWFLQELGRIHSTWAVDKDWREKSNYWFKKYEEFKKEKKGTIKVAKNKPNGKPKNKPKTGGMGTGTGFVVTKDGVIATDEHVVNGCNKIEVDNLEASIVVADDKNDIALIKVNKTYKDIASIKVRSPKLGDDVMVFGYPLSGILSSIHVSLTKGSVSSLSGMRDDTSRFRYTAASQPGNSGGPIVDDKGMVVGIVSAGLKNDKSLDVNWQNVNFGVRSSLLVNLMDSKNITVTTQEIPKEEIIGHYEKVSRYIKCFK